MSKTVMNWKDLTSLIILQTKRDFLRLPLKSSKIDGKNREKRINKKQAAWKETALHGQFLRETDGMQDKKR